MTEAPPDIKTLLAQHKSGGIHLMGVAGFGMAGLAWLLHARGYRVSGCDLQQNRLTKRLMHEGIPVMLGHDASHLDKQVDMVIRSTAVPPQHPEVNAARDRGIPVFRRGETLAALLDEYPSVAISGTHGKTTTTAMTVHLLRAAGSAPSFFIGGEWEETGRVAGQGECPWLVVEADESDGTLAYYTPDIGVITGIDYDHMEHFEHEAAFLDTFSTFARRIKRRMIYCGDDTRLKSMVSEYKNTWSYGFSDQVDLRGTAVQASKSGLSCTLEFQNQIAGSLRLPMHGRHNLLNAMAAWLVAREMGLQDKSAEESFSAFKPVARRYQHVATRGGANIISDYAHHPAEIKALIAMAQQAAPKRILAVFQPHRYTRTRALGPLFPPAFEGVDHVWLCPVYAASEQPAPGGGQQDLLMHFQTHKATAVTAVDSLTSAWDAARRVITDGDLLLIIGAGDVEQIAQWAEDEVGGRRAEVGRRRSEGGSRK